MIHLDTHVVVWLYAHMHELIPEKLRQRLESEALAISPMVQLELSYLTEIGRLTANSGRIVAELSRALGLTVDSTSFATVVDDAANLAFTRDPFDRLICAQAIAAAADLATKDERIRRHVARAVWD